LVGEFGIKFYDTYFVCVYAKSLSCLCDLDKRRIYTVWTVSFLEHVRANLSDTIENLGELEPNQMSGETIFEMEKSGLVCTLRSNISKSPIYLLV
jgi:hypothetical protein